MAIAQRIFEARKEKLSLTQAELAHALNVEAVTVSRWERGIVEPRPSVIRELARLTGLPISWFFSESGDGTGNANAEPGRLSEQGDDRVPTPGG